MSNPVKVKDSPYSIHLEKHKPGKNDRCTSSCAFENRCELHCSVSIPYFSPILKESTQARIHRCLEKAAMPDDSLGDIEKQSRNTLAYSHPSCGADDSKHQPFMRVSNASQLGSSNAHSRVVITPTKSPVRISRSAGSHRSISQSPHIAKNHTESNLVHGAQIFRSKGIPQPKFSTPNGLQERTGSTMTKSERSIAISPTKNDQQTPSRYNTEDYSRENVKTPKSQNEQPDNVNEHKKLLSETPKKAQDCLNLNFSYQRKYFNKPGNENSEYKADTHSVIISNSESSVSSVEDFELVYRYRQKSKEGKTKQKPAFTKYIPVPIPIPLHVPKLLLNKMDPKEWEEAQEAYLRDRIQNADTSMSDTSIKDAQSQVLPRTPNKSVRCMPIKFKNYRKTTKNRGNHSLDQFTFDTLDIQLLRTPHNAPKRLDPRFDLDKADKFIKANTAQQPNYTCILYAALPDNPNFGLCHAMTELVVSAMLNFFHPYRDVQCLWINDIQGKLIDLLKDHSLKPKFTRLVYLRKFEAIMVLSDDASSLLRHKDMCFLHSITSALKISPHKLLILAREGKQQPFRPITA